MTPNQWEQKSRYQEKMELERRQRKNSNMNEYDRYKENRQMEELVIDQNTIYEIDLDCYDCLMREKRKLTEKSNHQTSE